MNQFDLDCMRRKDLARQSKHKINGSKSKRCSLPSDKLTQKQWKERCGPIMSYSLGSPMNWEQFKNIPSEIQVEYIKKLQDKFGATATDLANMFGVKPQTVRRFIESKDLNVNFSRGHSMNTSQKTEWNAFLTKNEINCDTGVQMRCDNSEEILEVPAVANEETHKMDMKRFSVQFNGAINIDMIANSLRLILGDSPSGQIEIICSLA